jgi:hypothetical protein
MNPARLALRMVLFLSGLGTASAQTVAQTTTQTVAQTTATPPAAVTAPALDVPAALQRAFSARTVKPEWFSPAFTAVLPQIQATVDGVRGQFGGLLRVEGSAGTYRLVYARGVVTVRASVDPAGR